MTEQFLTLAIPPEFAERCANRGLSVARVLNAVMADLGETDDSNGTNPRRHADAWFDSVVWPDPMDTPEERRQALTEAVASLRLEGLAFGDASADLRDAWVEGTMSGEEVRQRIIARAIEAQGKAR